MQSPGLISTVQRQGALRGRRILVTGAASGMGKAIAARFAESGAALVLTDVNGDGLKSAADEVGGFAWQADITSEAEVKALAAEAARMLDGLDGVVNCAGILTIVPLVETDADTWKRVFAVNLFGAVSVCRYSIPELLKSRGATIVNIASTVSLRPYPGFAAYSASKAALLSLTKSLAMELAPAIRANAIGPGPIRTPMNETTWAKDEYWSEQASAAHVALGRVGEPVEIANAALFLTSTESSFVNGEMMIVDGGGTYA